MYTERSVLGLKSTTLFALLYTDRCVSVGAQDQGCTPGNYDDQGPAGCWQPTLSTHSDPDRRDDPGSPATESALAAVMNEHVQDYVRRVHEASEGPCDLAIDAADASPRRRARALDSAPGLPSLRPSPSRRRRPRGGM